jgi:hypothetical protein
MTIPIFYLNFSSKYSIQFLYHEITTTYLPFTVSDLKAVSVSVSIPIHGNILTNPSRLRDITEINYSAFGWLLMAWLLLRDR